MFDPIGEPNVRTIIKPEPTIQINERELQIQKDQKLRESRAIENSEDSSEVKNENNEKDKKQSSKYKMEEDKIIYEKYNRNGELIFRIPPKQNPLDALA